MSGAYDRGITRSAGWALAAIALFATLYATSLYSYLLFHSAVELFGIAVSMAVFMVAWHSRRYLDNGFLAVLAAAFLCVGLVSSIHMLAYSGMGVFVDHDADLPTQLWIVSRYIQAGGLLLAPLTLGRKVHLGAVVSAMLAVTGLLVASVFAGVFPAAFIEGQGLTPFKVWSEYAVTVVFVLTVVMILIRGTQWFEPAVRAMLLAALTAAIFSEIAFSLYSDPYGPANLIGHFMQVILVYLLYRALVRTALEEPYALLFRELKQRENALARANRFSEALNLIDTEMNRSRMESDRIFEGVVRTAGQTLGSDASTVSLRNPDGSFTVRYAAGELGRIVDTTLREEAAHLRQAAETRSIVFSEDLAADERVHPLIRSGFGMASLITLPLVVRGTAVGTLSFYWRDRHAPTEDEVGFASQLGSDLSLALENARLYAAERHVAETLQAGLVSVPETIPGLEVGCVYEAGPGEGRIGGDFYDVFNVGPDMVAVVIGDVCGKGIGAAAVTAMVRSTVKAYAFEDAEPDRVLRRSDAALGAQLDESQFVTMLYGLIDTSTGTFKVASAGHYDPVVLGRPWEETCLEHNLPLGMFPGKEFHVATFDLREGETVVMFTDGLIEARRDGEVFGEERVRDALSLMGTGPRAQHVADSLLAAAQGFSEGTIQDDIAVLALRLSPR